MNIKLAEEAIPRKDSTTFRGVSIDWIGFHKRLYDELRLNIKHPMRSRVIPPGFSTTEQRDRLTAAVIMNSASQYQFQPPRWSHLPKELPGNRNTFMGRLPSVTLLGDKADWERLLSQTRDLLLFNIFGQEPRTWLKLLMHILSLMVRSFERPDEDATKDF